MRLSCQENTIILDTNGSRHVYTQAHATELFELLCAWRRKAAEESNLPPYKIAENKSLRCITEVLPLNTDTLWLVDGMTAEKIKTYGEGIVEVVVKYLNRHLAIRIEYGTCSISRNSRTEVILGYLGLTDYFFYRIIHPEYYEKTAPTYSML